MSDSLRNDIVDANIVSGEQPTATKLSSFFAQLRAAINRTSEAIGDLFSQQSNGISLADLPNVGPNLSRIIGSTGWLNPRHLGRIRTTSLSINYYGGYLGTGSGGYTWYANHTFVLPYQPVIYSGLEGSETGYMSYSFTNPTWWTIGAPDSGVDVSTTKLATRVTNIANLNASGEYHVSFDGIITTYDPILSGEGFKVTYTFDIIHDSYDGASLNVIPDFSESSSLCTVTDLGSGIYQIALPTIQNRRGSLATYNFRSKDPWSNWIGSVDDPMGGAQAELPRFLDSLSAGDIIPSGYIQIYDNTTGEVLSGGTFTYVSTTAVRCIDLSLVTGSSRYRIIVPGTAGSATISSIRESYYRHTHSGLVSLDRIYDGERIQHYDLLSLVDEGGSTKTGFVPSTIGSHRNPHPQYFHRYGYRFGESLNDPGNIHNAILGELVIAGTDDSLDASATSHRLSFSGPVTAGGPSIRYLHPTGLVVESDVLFSDDVSIAGGVGIDDELTVYGGDIEVNSSFNFKYSAVRTRYQKIGPEGGSPDPTAGWEYQEALGGATGDAYAYSGANGDTITYPIKVPNGTSITLVEAIVYPNSSSLNMYVFRAEEVWSSPYGQGSATDIISGGGPVSSSSGSNEKLSATLDSTVVNNGTCRYLVKFEASVSGQIIYGVRVRYTIDTVDFG